MYSLLKWRCLCWFGHIVRMDDGWIPKAFLYGELVQKMTIRPQVSLNFDTKMSVKATWESIVRKRPGWRQEMERNIMGFKKKRAQQLEAKRVRIKTQKQSSAPFSAFICSWCQRNCPLQLHCLATLSAVLNVDLTDWQIHSLSRLKEANSRLKTT